MGNLLLLSAVRRAARPLTAPLVAALLVAAPACDGGRPAAPGAPGAPGRKGVTELGAGEEVPSASGQTIYVPTYSYVNISDAARPFNLALTLSVRNADPKEAIVVTAVRYHGADGHLVRDYLPRPVRLAPLAALDSFVKESDTSGGSSTSFVVEWSADRAVAAPVVEAVMVGTLGNQGVSLLGAGRVVAEHGR
jgi:hypothetical protein